MSSELMTGRAEEEEEAVVVPLLASLRAPAGALRDMALWLQLFCAEVIT
jgi:hypothetical protein